MKVDGSEKLPDYTYLWEEYKLLQDKVDKIGAFRYQVKGWLIPLISAWLVAVYTARITPLANLLAIIFPWLFSLLEQNHHAHQKAFLRRITAIENELLQKASPPFFGPRPKVSKSERNDLSMIMPISPRQAISLANRELEKTYSGKLILAAHVYFYRIVTLAVVVVSVLSIPSIAKRFKDWFGQEQSPQCSCAITLPAAPLLPGVSPNQVQSPAQSSSVHRAISGDASAPSPMSPNQPEIPLPSSGNTTTATTSPGSPSSKVSSGPSFKVKKQPRLPTPSPTTPGYRSPQQEKGR